MRTIKKFLILAISFVGLSTLAHAENTSSMIHLKPGEMEFMSFLEMVSDQLDLQINASGLGSVSGTVVVPDTGALTSDRAKSLVLSILYLQGYTWIHDSATDLYRVMRVRDARDQETPMITEPARLPDNDLLVTYVLSLENTPPDYIARIVRSFMPAFSRIIPEDLTRSVLITDSARNIGKIRKIIQQVDTPQVAKHVDEWLVAQAKGPGATCSEDRAEMSVAQSRILIALFSLIALVIGFLARGYVIRRIEGGL
jgi:type II secretory pathway component GspD/PulD (secretin)